MNVAKDHVVEIHYTLTNNDGEIVDSSSGKDPLAYLHGHKNIVAGLEKDLEGKTIGDKFKSTVSPEEGYGELKNDLIAEVPKQELASIPNLEPGLTIQGQSQSGGVQIFTVVEVKEETVTLDGNHPLAGQTLNFDVEVMKIRAASEEEVKHGHAHGPGGHHH